MGVTELIILSIILTCLLGASIGLLICNRNKYKQIILELGIDYNEGLCDLDRDIYLLYNEIDKLKEEKYELKLENSNLKGLNEALNRRIKELEERK